MRIRSIEFYPVPVALRVRCRATLEQQRMMYLAGRQANEDQLAERYRREQSARILHAEAALVLAKLDLGHTHIHLLRTEK
jgi:hypothetical protein